jgi:hypothetical protein
LALILSERNGYSESSRKNSHTVSEISGYQSSIVTFWPLLEINSKPLTKKKAKFHICTQKVVYCGGKHFTGPRNLCDESLHNSSVQCLKIYPQINFCFSTDRCCSFNSL